MCGILGLINKKTETEFFKNSLDRLIHRGPDGYGIWQEDDASVTLGHRRLSILDLSENGKQPMLGFEDRYVLTFNGEIYNFLEIKDELIRKGYFFNSDSDSEVLLYAYIEWGEDCLNRFNGMWAFAVYDRVKRELFLSRDRFGVKPLFYTWLDSAHTQLAFASEMKALLPFMKEIRPNMAICRHPELMTVYEGGEDCIIEGIYRFPAASYAVFSEKNGFRVKRFYKTLDHIHEVPSDYAKQSEEFRELFLNACALRMRSDVPLGTALSGGLDSSATICTMAELSKRGNFSRMNDDWQHAFVAAFPGTTMDETAYARQVTDFLGIKSTEVVIDPSKSIDSFEKYIYLFEELYLTSPIPMMELYGALRKEGTLVTIDGHGADELFGGYTFDFIHALSDAGFNKNDQNMILDAYINSFPDDGSNMALKNRSRGAVLNMYRKRQFKSSIKWLLKGGTFGEKKHDAGYEKLDALNKILYASSHENILPTLLRNYDHYSMASGVEIRMPFMDYRIVEYAFSIGWKSKLHGGYSKSIIRDALEPFMPKDIVRRRTKIGFNSPIVEWMQGPMKEYFLDIIAEKGFKESSLIDSKMVADKIEKVINGGAVPFARGEEAFSAVYPYLWEKSFLKHKDLGK